MKFESKDFNSMPQGKQIKSSLKKISELKPNAPPYPHFERLYALMFSSSPEKSVPVVFRYMGQICGERKDLTYLNFMMHLKLSFFLRHDLLLLDDNQLIDYVNVSINLRKEVPLLPPSSSSPISEELARIYLWNALMLYSNSNDLLVFAEYGKFSNPFKVKCHSCGNDIHSLCIDVEHMENTSHITPAPPPEKQTELLFFDDIYQSFWQIFDNFNETYFSKLLPYLYGSYQCTQCGATNHVMTAIKSALFPQKNIALPSEALVQRLETLIQQDKGRNYQQLWNLITFTMSITRNREGLSSLRAMVLPMNTALSFEHLLPSTIQNTLLEMALPLLPLPSEDTASRIYLLHLCILYLFDPEEPTKHRHQITSMYEELLPLAQEELDHKQKHYVQIQVHHAYFLSKTSRNGKDRKLLAIYPQAQAHPSVLYQLEGYLYHLYAEEENFEQAIIYKTKENEHIKALVGTDSLQYSQALRDLATLRLQAGEHYDKAINLQAAIDLFQKAYDLNVTLLGKEYLLPPSLRKIAHSKNKFLKKAKKDEILAVYVRSASGSCGDMGQIAFRLGDYKEAMIQFVKAMDLWSWVTQEPQREGGEYLLHIALTHEKLNKKKLSKEFCEKAMECFHVCMNRNITSHQEDILTKQLDLAEDLQKRLDGTHDY